MLTFRTRYPEVNIGLYQMSKSEQIHALRTNQITIGFGNASAGGTRHHGRDRLLRADDHRHSCQQRIGTIRTDSLHPFARRTPIILYPNATRPSFADTVTAFLRDNHVDVQYTQEAPDVVTALTLVSSGFGVCITRIGQSLEPAQCVVPHT